MGERHVSGINEKIIVENLPKDFTFSLTRTKRQLTIMV
jgi:hypothetical protein